MTPEMMRDFLEMYKLMSPENFINILYAMAKVDGRLAETRDCLAAIDRLRPNPEDYTIMDKIRDEAVND